MKQLTLSMIVSILVIFFAGCAKPCFYQAGKSIEQCESDLLKCFYSARPTHFCMQARGYQYLDANKLPQNRRRKKVMVLSEENMASGKRKAMYEVYWVADGLGVASGDRRIMSEQTPQKNGPNASPRKLMGYRVRQDDLGKFTKTPVYEDEQKK